MRAGATGPGRNSVAARRWLAQTCVMADAHPPADDLAAMLHAHDTQPRAGAEMTAARSVTADGPLLRGVFPWGGFVSYSSLDGVDDVDALIERTIAHFRDRTEVAQFEWKTRGHDAPADLPGRLVGPRFRGGGARDRDVGRGVPPGGGNGPAARREGAAGWRGRRPGVGRRAR